MRTLQNPQLQFGQVDISKIEFDPKSRDDIPQLLKGLQYIYVNRPVREEIFSLLEKHILPQVDKRNGRPGMELWKILVLGVLRLDLNCDYDRIHNLANCHSEIRQMLGHTDFFDKSRYQMQTIKDNVSLLTVDLLNEINQIVVNAGHVLVKKKVGEALRGRCDSFVLETNVHYPTDINLLYDAMRKVIELTARWCENYELSDWRQNAYNLRHIKRLMRQAQLEKRPQGQTEAQQEKRQKLIKKTHREYIETANHYLMKVKFTIEKLEKEGFLSVTDVAMRENIYHFMRHAERQINQIDRRVLRDEVIPHEEKIFSIFEPHTEWISKGKARTPVELGLRVCILEDQYQFILHHHVMEKETDDKIAQLMVKESQARFPDLKAASFDKGFHSKQNQDVLSKELELLALPRKGKLSQAAQAIEKAEEFRQARRKHSAVESAINGLEVHGLDRCLDHGIAGFKRYVALSIVARNLHRIGAILYKQEQEREARKRKKYHSRDGTFKLAA